MKVFLADQALDYCGAGGRRAQALLAHGLAQFVVLQQLARPFHCRQQRGFAVAGGRLGLDGHGLDVQRPHLLVGPDRRQVLVLFLGGLAINRKPAGVLEDAALGLELVAGDFRDARGLQVFRRGVEHREEAPHDEVVEFLLRLRQALGRLQRRDDREVVGDLAVVEDPFVRLDPAFLEDLGGVHDVRPFLEHLQCLLHRRHVVFRQRARIGTRVGQDLVLFIEGLRESQRVLGGKPETAVGFTLQAGKVEEQRRHLRRGLGLFRDGAGLALASRANRLGPCCLPQAFGLFLAVFLLLPPRVEPPAGILAGFCTESRVDLPVIARLETADLLFALYKDREGRGLHPAHGREVEAALLGVECGHRPRAVDADQPVGFGPRLGRVGQRQHIAVRAQFRESIADRCLGHRLKPEALDRLLRLGVLDDVAEDQFTFAPRVTGVHQRIDVLPLDEAQQHVEARFTTLDRTQVEMRRDDGQVGKGPLAFLYVVRFGQDQLKQVADR